MGDERAIKPSAWTSAWSAGPCRIRFLGLGGPVEPAELADYLEPPPAAVCWLRQVHSGRVLDAAPGEVGEADGMVSDRTDLALAIATADCVPVLLAAPGRIGAAHAGWRGLVAGVIGATLDRLDTDPAQVEAWLGPTIGSCCYEVGGDVAAQIAAVSSDPLVIATPAGRKPHADLHRAAFGQLTSRGVRRIYRVPRCTRCDRQYWSYRRDGAGAGRNWSVIWRQPATASA
jgi:YfiH family protein